MRNNSTSLEGTSQDEQQLILGLLAIGIACQIVYPVAKRFVNFVINYQTDKDTMINEISKIQSQLTKARLSETALTPEKIKELADSFYKKFNNLLACDDRGCLMGVLDFMKKRDPELTAVMSAVIHAGVVSRQIDHIKSLPENSNEYQFFLEAMKNIFGEKEVSKQMIELSLTPSQAVSSASSSSTTLHCRTLASSSGQQP